MTKSVPREFIALANFTIIAARHGLQGFHVCGDVRFKGAGYGQVVTDIDEDIDRIARKHFLRVVSEESEDGKQDKAAAYQAATTMMAAEESSAIVDPIDGTRNFIDGRFDWGVQGAVVKRGWPVSGILALPCLNNSRAPVHGFRHPTTPADHHGVVFAAWENQAYIAPMRGGRFEMEEFVPLEVPPRRAIAHVGWPVRMANNFVLDYQKAGYFPGGGATSCIADFAALLLGETSATFFNAALWDLAPAEPILQAVGLGLYGYPNLNKPPRMMIEMFDENFLAEQPWIVARSHEDAAHLANSVQRANVHWPA